MTETRRSPSWIAPRGLRAKLAWACLLMSVVPLTMLVLVAAWFAFPAVRAAYQLDRLFPMIAVPGDSTWWLLGLIALTALVTGLGSVYLATKVVGPVIRISRAAGRIAGGQPAELPVTDPDELGQLSGAIHQLTGRLREEMSELRHFGEQTSRLNQRIQDRVLRLSGLLQLGELISRGAELPVVLDQIVDLARADDDQAFSFLLVAGGAELPVCYRAARGIDTAALGGWDGRPAQPIVIDAVHEPDAAVRALWSRLGQGPLLLQPISLRRGAVGVLGLGTRQARPWAQETVELVAILARHASLALEHELLLKTTRELSVRDELTGVYNETYMRQRLQEEIRRAVLYQRPCAYAVFAIEHLAEFRQRYGEPEAEHLLKRVAQLVQQSVSEVDRVGRVNGSQLAVLLPERSKREALDIVEHVRQQVQGILTEVRLLPEPLVILSGVSENPLDGNMAEDLMNRAVLAMRQPPAGTPRT